MHIGKITGNIVVGQSGGPTAAINSSLAGVYKAGKEAGADKVYGMLNGIQGLLKGKLIDLSEKITCDLELELLKRTPAAYLGSCRYKLPDYEKDAAPYEQLFQILKEHGIAAFFYIGGNDSMDSIRKLSEYGESVNSSIKFIGIPKTVDNDLEITDHTPGYGSAAKFIAAATKEIIRDSLVYDQNNLTIIEIMGRHAGWLTAAAALCKDKDCQGPDRIYLPEKDFDRDVFLKDIKALQQEKKSVVIAVSEGIHLADGRFVCELSDKDSYIDEFGHTMLTGAGAYLAALVKKELNCKTRAIELNTLQRCASHLASLSDITEAFEAGRAGVMAAARGITGEMAVIKRVSDSPYQCAYETHNIKQIANMEKKVPLSWIKEGDDGLTKEFIRYARPLIMGEVMPVMVNGLPAHMDNIQ